MPEPVVRQANVADFTFQAGELSSQELKVSGFTGTEGLSQLYEFRVELVSDDHNIDFNAVIGKPCFLEIAGRHGSRFVNGIVRRFERIGEGSNVSHYAAEIVPMHWLLTKRIKSRIFQAHNCADMSIPGVIKKVLADAGIPEDRYRLALQGQYDALEYVVQYCESDMNFIQRLMEQEGIFYYFEHAADGHKMVLGDSPVAHVETPGAAKFPYRDPSGLVPEKEFIYHVRDQQEIQIGAICLEGYNFKQPATELRATAKAKEYTSLELCEYPGNYFEKALGDRYAQTRLEEQQCTKRVVQLASLVRCLISGFKFTLEEHPSEALNREFLVTHISHRASQRQAQQEETGENRPPEYEADVRAIPADVPYRPPRVTPRPVVAGIQTALVVGPSGEEIYTDDEGYGRVKVQFHWDLEGTHNENSSCWVRCSQGWAGGNYGMIQLPRVGQEVIVDFLDGIADYPMIVGRVYNNDNMPPYPLPAEKTKSTIKSRSSKGGGGFNELRFEDKKDSEQIFVHAQKDMDVRIKEVEKRWTGKDKHEIVKGARKTSVGSENLSVGGDDLLNVKGKYSIKVEGDYAVGVAGNAAIGADGDLYCVGAKAQYLGDSYAELSATNVVVEATAQLTLKCGGAFVVIGPAGVDISGPLVKINSGGSAGAAQAATMATCTDAAAPLEAATGDPGKDFTYQSQPHEFEPLETAPILDETEPPITKHWIGIRLWDDNGLPLAGERYVVLLPDGTKVARGRTNAKGEAEIRGIDPGSCEVRFPDLDAKTWEAGPASPSSGSGAGSTPSAGSSASSLPTPPSFP